MESVTVATTETRWIRCSPFTAFTTSRYSGGRAQPWKAFAEHDETDAEQRHVLDEE